MTEHNGLTREQRQEFNKVFGSMPYGGIANFKYGTDLTIDDVMYNLNKLSGVLSGIAIDNADDNTNLASYRSIFAKFREFKEIINQM